TEPRGCAADDRCRRIEIKEAYQQRTSYLLHVDHRSDRRHRSIARLDPEVADGVDTRPVLGQRLRVELKDVSKLVELRRIVRADVGRQGGKNIADGDAKRLGLDAVDSDIELRGVGPEGRV